MTRPILSLAPPTGLSAALEHEQPARPATLHPPFGRPRPTPTTARTGRNHPPRTATIIAMPRVIPMPRRAPGPGFQPEHPDHDPAAA